MFNLPTIAGTTTPASIPTITPLASLVPPTSAEPLQEIVPSYLTPIVEEVVATPPTMEECLAIGQEKLGQLGAYFGEHNRRKINPQQDRNYTIETLYYMAPNAVGASIAGSIVASMLRIGISRITIIEVCGGIGGNTMAFLDRPEVGKVVTYEAREDRQAMLRNNLQDYGYDPARYEIRGEANRDLIPEIENAPVYIDPPWLPPGVPFCAGPEFYSNNIVFGGMSLEDWVRRFNAAPLIVMRLPPWYWSWKKNPPTGFSWMRLPSTPAWIYTFFPQEVRTIRDYLRKQLLPALDVSPQNIPRITTQAAMEDWLKAFTHSSANMNPGYNYEVYETLGDVILKAAFAETLYANFPNITESEIGNLTSYYMSKDRQARMASDLGIPAHIISRINLDKHIREDVLEAVFGALLRAGDRVRLGVGYVLVRVALAKLFPPEAVDVQRYGAQVPWTQIGQLFQQAGWESPIRLDKQEEGGWHVILGFTNTAYEKVRARGVPKILADIVSYPKKVAEAEAATRALSVLEQHGITPSGVAAERTDIGLAELANYSEALAKARRVGFKAIEFPRARKGKRPTYMQVIGVYEDGTRDVLYTMEDLQGLAGKPLREEILRRYIEQR